jgi:hypothetical protein
VIRAPYTISATYGSSRTKCTLYVLPTRSGWWYVCDGSCNVNHTPNEPEVGGWIEEWPDNDTFTWPNGVHSEEELEQAVDA